MSETTNDWIARVRSTGSADIPVTGDMEDLAKFRGALRQAARAEGLTVHTAVIGRMIFAWNPDHEISDEQERALRAAPDRAPTPPSIVRRRRENLISSDIRRA